MSQKYVCAKCGTAVELLYKGGCIPSCCGEPMQLMEAKTEDFVKEKHVPYIETTSCTSRSAPTASR